MLKILSILRCIIVLTLLLSVGCSSAENNAISPSEAANLQKTQQAVIIDVRDDKEWQQQHIPGAIHIPLAQLNNRLGELAAYKNTKLVMQCHSGGRSAKATELLTAAGFSNVSNMDGGLLAWNKAGLATE